LAPNPRLLMLDEPLGSLDANLRDRLVVELRDIIKRVGLTAIYVTHDQQEAFAIADRIAVMNAGQIEQIAAPEDIYRRPSTVFVARFMGLSNIIPVADYREGTAYLEINDYPVNAPEFQPEAVLLHPDGLTLANEDEPPTFEGQVTECVFRGSRYRLRVDVQGVTLGLQSPRGVEVGQRVGLHATPDAWVPLRS
jgi:thiamine transport system ATP-binding protein